MYGRNRSPGNGYRSSPMGMAAAASRISPEDPMRGPSFYSSDHRNFNRGFVRGHPKPYQPPRRGDIFMEAGRLAAEYLVSKGLLPPTALPGKWQNASVRKQAGDFQEFRQQDGENIQLPSESRTPALARLGNSVSDAASGRRRFPDEYNSTGTGSRNSMRGRRRMGSFRNYGLDWDQDNGKISLCSDKARASSDVEADNDSVSSHHEEQQGGQDGCGVQNPCPRDLAPKTEGTGNSESDSWKFQSMDDMGLKSSSSAPREELPLDIDKEITKEPDGTKSLNAGSEEVKDGTNHDDMDKNRTSDDFFGQECALGVDSISKHGADLLSLCNFAKVPTKTRSSLVYRGAKADTMNTAEEGIASDVGPPGGSRAAGDDSNLVDGSLGDKLSNQLQGMECLDSDMRLHSVQSVGDARESGSYAVEQGKCVRSQSFPDRTLIYEEESGQGQAGFGRCISMDSRVKERSEKRAIQYIDWGEGTKKMREWIPSKVTQADEYSNLSSFIGKQISTPEERTSPGEELVMAIDQDNPVDNAVFPKGVVEPCIEYAEEKQLLPGSFKICDLNLIEASEMNENQDHDPILMYPSMSETRKEAAPLDIDLSISNNCNMPIEQVRHATDGKEVEVIDLENDSVEEAQALTNSERKTETVYTGLQSFPNHAQNTSDIQDVPDGYGLMISELLGDDIPNCSSVPADINSLHNEIGLHNGEGILSDDDPIYMSLGEIPISFSRVWEQPTQEYEKPF